MLIRATEAGDSPRHVALIFGLGLIGKEISQWLAFRGYRWHRARPFSWTCRQQQEADARAVLEYLRRSARPPESLSVVWSAGATGFGATEEQMSAELANMESALELVHRVVDVVRPEFADFHLMSSAGGLFEGQRSIGANNEPAPRRPYGYFKLEQERLVRDRLPSHCWHIYRPSSVYGRQGKRKLVKGLINVLIRNTAAGLSTNLEARGATLRDYVFAGDIGRFVSERVGRRSDGGIHYLVTGRSHSIQEIRHKIGRVMMKPVYYRLDPNFGNSADMTFDPSVVPRGWNPLALEAGVRQILLKPQPLIR